MQDRRFIVIDSGNTALKWALCNEKSIGKVSVSPRSSLQDILGYLSENSAEACIISSVTTLDPLELESLNSKCKVVEAKTSMRLPVRLNYLTPETLGIDRLANVVAAHRKYPLDPVLIIDAGTCYKIDFVNKGVFEGGAISPGLRMRFAALHTFTDRLPQINYREVEFLNGKSTEESILSGVVNGSVEEIKGTIGRYRQLYPALKVILTGGDADIFAISLKNSIFAAPNLALYGLHELLLLQLKENGI